MTRSSNSSWEQQTGDEGNTASLGDGTRTQRETGPPQQTPGDTVTVEDDGLLEKPGRRLSSLLEMLNWMPPRCRYDPQNPPQFTLAMNILLGFVSPVESLGESKPGQEVAGRRKNCN